jgi:hypothetical protein
MPITELNEDAHLLLVNHTRSDRIDGHCSELQELERGGYLIPASGDTMEGHYFPYAKTKRGGRYVRAHRARGFTELNDKYILDRWVLLLAIKQLIQRKPEARRLLGDSIDD